jgi:hypothetical protein
MSFPVNSQKRTFFDRISPAQRPRRLRFGGFLFAILAAFGALAQVGQAATSIQNFSAATNDRFANNPAFIGSAWNWSGVGRSNNDTWGTMITSSVFLSANHYHPGVGNQMTFFPGNNPGGVPVTRTVVSGQRIGSSDLWLGFLNATLPTTITAYDFSREAISEANFVVSGLNDVPVFLGGVTPTGSGYGVVSATVQTVGTNRLEGFWENLTVGSTGTGDVLLTVQNLAGDGVFGYTHTNFEAQLQGGDSGSPLMVSSGGRLMLAGIAWAVGPGDIDPTALVANRPVSAFTYTGSYTDKIVTLVPELAIVPEPASALATAVFLASGLLLRRRSSQQQILWYQPSR